MIIHASDIERTADHPPHLTSNLLLPARNTGRDFPRDLGEGPVSELLSQRGNGKWLLLRADFVHREAVQG